MNEQTKQEELRQRIISYMAEKHGGLPVVWDELSKEEQQVVDEVIELINSEVLSVLEELKSESHPERFGQSDEVFDVVLTSVIPSIENRYKL